MRGNMIDINQKYGLLENGEIEPLFYENGEMRMVYKEGKKFYIDHDAVFGNVFALMHHRIVWTSDSEDELKAKKEELGLKETEWINVIRKMNEDKVTKLVEKGKCKQET